MNSTTELQTLITEIIISCHFLPESMTVFIFTFSEYAGNQIFP